MNDSVACVDDLTATLKLLKCVLCDNILSVAPVLTISDDQYQCGRCKDIKYSNLAMRNVIFERVGKYLNFPCIYTNCDIMIPWKDVETHEKHCPFKTITCPMFHEECDEKVNLNELSAHMVQKHGNHVFFENIVVTVATFKSFVCVASVNSEVYLVYICSDKVLVTSLKPDISKFKYTLKLCSNNKNTPSIVYENQPIEEFDERKHCFRCLDNRCDVKYHPFSRCNKPVNDNTVIPQHIKDNGTSVADKLKKTQYIRAPTYKKPATTKSAPFNIFGQGSTFGTSNKLVTTTSSATFVTTTSSSLFSNTAPSNTNATFSNFFNSTVSSASGTSTTTSCTGKTDSTKSTLNANAPSFLFILPTVTTASSAVNDNTESAEVVDKTETATNTSSRSENDGITQNEQTQAQVIKCTTYNLSHVQNLVGIIPTVTFSITITSDEDIEGTFCHDSFIPRNLLNTIDNSDLLRKVLECPICTEYMVDSIYVCDRGHHICNTCKMVQTYCPSCQAIISSARNFALEHMAEGVSLSCTFKENGCEFRGNLKVISEHEKNCTQYKEKNDNNK